MKFVEIMTKWKGPVFLTNLGQGLFLADLDLYPFLTDYTQGFHSKERNSRADRLFSSKGKYELAQTNMSALKRVFMLSLFSAKKSGPKSGPVPLFRALFFCWKIALILVSGRLRSVRKISRSGLKKKRENCKSVTDYTRACLILKSF